ncbi:MAG: erv26 super protein [Alectoria fallacina]|uniref:Erv26 super protein n=1 Tax=Alectoria fallacina TaxID=1903189 RepID=A0A8H3INU8_9LECA|nr:MAG: erv26 super protein [Alectoria fallacina]
MDTYVYKASYMIVLILILIPISITPRPTQADPSSIASGLYYLSELVEEHTVFARKLLTRLIYAIIAIQTLLTLIDRFPLALSLVSIASHGVYVGNLRHFPTVKLTDPVFILSCGKLPFTLGPKRASN